MLVAQSSGISGISGNECADSAAKAALQKVISECLILYTDAYQYLSQYVCDLWQCEWDMVVTNKLHATKPLCPDLLFERSQVVVITVIDQNHYA